MNAISAQSTSTVSLGREAPSRLSTSTREKRKNIIAKKKRHPKLGGVFLFCNRFHKVEESVESLVERDLRTGHIDSEESFASRTIHRSGI